MIGKKMLCARYFEIEESIVGTSRAASDLERLDAATQLLSELFPNDEHTQQEVELLLQIVDDGAAEALNQHGIDQIRKKLLH